jgi:FkbH-like protein
VTRLLAVAGKWADKNPQKTLVISSLVFPPQTLINYLDDNTEYSFDRIERECGRVLQDFVLSRKNVLLFDFHRIVKRFGFDFLCDDKYWYLGRIKYTEAGFTAICKEFNGLIRAAEGKSRKVLVCDLDNVLWGGIVGEDGPLGIELSEEGAGKAYRDFQKAVKALKELGVLLAINSKNNEKDAREAFEKNPMMVLSWDDFVVAKVNWNNKAANLQETCAELGLGLDSIVMIDDSARERHLIKEALPTVVVPEFPRNTALLKNWLINDVVYPYFGKTALTEEDRDKARQYKSKLQRDSLAQDLDLSEYIRSLGINLEILKNPLDYVDRLAQLTQKTNQFNLTAKRYQANEIQALIRSGADIYGLRYQDKFGDEGLIGAAIVTNSADEAVLDVFLLSCRVLGRQVEFQFMELILNDLAQSGKAEISGVFVPTGKNKLAEGFYAQCGFEEAGAQRYKAHIAVLIRKMHNMAVK